MTKADWIKRFALSLIIQPSIMLCIPIWAALNEPMLVIEYWGLYLPLLGVPYAAGIGLWIWAGRLRKAA